MVRLTIDGRAVEVPEGTTIVDAAARLGIEVPVYCYHPALGPLGACRMCLVRVEKMPKLATGCTTPVAEGMVVHTSGPDVDKGRAGVLEFLLLNHPLDCPVCDKGGECFLQDYTYRYGPGRGRFREPKLRKAKDAAINEFIVIDQERCVLCQRCVRFLGEYAGEPQLVLEGRGVETVVTPAGGVPVQSIFSGNVVDLCPVGALLSRSYRFKARPWNIEKTESFCQLCPVGCPQFLTGRDNHVVRAEGRPLADRDFGWQCDRGRFGYDFGYHPSRLLAAVVEGEPMALAEANRIVGGWIRAAREAQGGDAVGFVLGGGFTTEEAYQLQHFARQVVGSSRLAVLRDCAGGLPRALNGTYADLAAADRVLLVGTDPYEAVPVVYLKLRDARRHHPVDVMAIGGRPLTRPGLAGTDWVVPPLNEAATLAAALKATAPDPAAPALATLTQALGDWSPPLEAAALQDLGQRLWSAQRLVILWDGIDAGVAAVAAALRRLRAGTTAVLPAFGPINWRGYERAGWPTDLEQLTRLLEAAAAGRIRVLVLWGADLLRYYPDPGLAERALAAVERVVAVGWYPPASASRADALLPAAAWGEVTGTYVNMEARLLVALEAVPPPADSRPARSLLSAFSREFGRALGDDPNWDPFGDSADDCLPPEADPEPWPIPQPPAPPVGEGLWVVPTREVYLDGPPSEILTPRIPTHPVRLHPADAARLGVAATGGSVDLVGPAGRVRVKARPDPRIPVGRVAVPLGIPENWWGRLGSRWVQAEAVTEQEVAAR